MVVSDRHRALLKIVIDLFTSCGDLGVILDKESESTEKFQCQSDLIGYLTQPFRITEPFRGTPGESVSEAAMLDGVQAILERHGLTP
jgi:F0F1-type ATP synthase beta subunit